MASTHRVLSLLPAAAETLWAAGGIEHLVGRGHEDDYPPEISRLPIVTDSKIKFTTSAEVDAAVCASVQASKASTAENGDNGLYHLHEDLIRELKPSVIITQGLCSVCAVSQPAVLRIASSLDPVPEVVSLSPVTLEDIINDVIRVGKAVDLEASAKAAAEALTIRVDKAKKIALSLSESKAQFPNVCFMEWTEPIYVGGHWTPQLIEYAGGCHPLNPPLSKGGPAGLSITRTREEVSLSDPDWIIVCPCGLDIKTSRKELAGIQRTQWWRDLRAVKSGQVVLVDGHQMFNRSAPRIVDALEFTVGLLHHQPEIIPKDFPWEPLTPNQGLFKEIFDSAPAAVRVLSLVPDAAETLCVAGGMHLLVGRGHEDDFPPEIAHLPVVTSTKIKFTSSAEVDAAVSAAKAQGIVEEDDGLFSLDKELIRKLRPTVILTQGLCSVCAVSQSMVMRFAKSLDPIPDVVTLSPVSLEDIIAGVLKVGMAVGLEDSARAAADALQKRVENAKAAAKDALEKKKVALQNGDSALALPGSNHAGVGDAPGRPKVLFMEWVDPIYVGGHWTPQLIHFAGGQHPLNPPISEGGPAGQSSKRTREEVTESDPDWIIVCPCGLDIKTTKKELESIRHLPWWRDLRAVKEKKVVVVDGNQMFNRSGPRMVDALEFLVGLLHDMPSIIPTTFPWEALAE